MAHEYEFQSKSSPSSPPHVTTARDDGGVSCTCPGYRNRGYCWHVDEVKGYAHDPTTCDAGAGCQWCAKVWNEVRAQLLEAEQNEE